MARLLEGRAAIGHLLRRAGFGHGPGTQAFEGSISYEAAVERLLAGLGSPPPPLPPDFDPYRPGLIQRTWLARLLSGAHPLAERLTLFWHGHFATSQAKVADGLLLWRQLELLRAQGSARFADLLLAVSRDVAMIRWLDGNANRKGQPNENYARELMELFALGRGAYDEGDVREVARAFTGWGSQHHTFAFTPALHDDGVKSFLGHQGRLTGEDAVAAVAAHPACALHMCSKFLRAFSHPDPTPEEIEALAVVWRASGGEVRAVLRALFLAPAFRAEERQHALVRGPVEFVVAAARARDLSELPESLSGSLDRLGQVLFRPPSVKGWPSGTSWLTAGTVVERLRAAQALAADCEAARVDGWLVRAFDGELAAPLEATLGSTAGPERLALALAAPEFQVA